MAITDKLSSNKKNLAENFVSLSVLQGANYILPLITLPYLYRVLGPADFGLVAFAQAFMQYFILFTDYGFNLSATGKISKCREDIAKVSQVTSAVMFIKLILLFLSLLLVLAFAFLIPKFKSDSLIYLYAFGAVIGNALFPVWFFQGMEKMRYITILNLLAKLIFTVAIFAFVKNQSDYLLVPAINSLGYIVAGVVSLWIVLKNFDVRLKAPKIAWVAEELRDGWHVFISTAAISLYTASNTFILGLFASNSIVGYYSAAEKVIKALQGLIVPMSQTIYPHINRLYDLSKELSLRFIRKAFFLVAGATFLISTITFLFADPIVSLVLGPQSKESIIIVRIMAFLPFIVGLSNIYGIQTMLTFGMKQVFSRILVFGGLTNILLALILTPLYKHVGTATAVVFTETFITVTMYLYLERSGIKILKGVLPDSLTGEEVG